MLRPIYALRLLPFLWGLTASLLGMGSQDWNSGAAPPSFTGSRDQGFSLVPIGDDEVMQVGGFGCTKSARMLGGRPCFTGFQL